MCRVYCIFLIIILLYIMLDKKEYFTIRETLAEKRADEIIKNRQFFNNDFYTARAVMPWIDAITYEDVRHLKHSDNLNKSSLVKLLK